MVRALVIGYGSIGRRHARILKDIGVEVSLVTRCDTADFQTFRTVQEALDATAPDYAVVANATADHYPTLAELGHLRFEGDVLVEKPLDTVLRPFPENSFRNCAVAYNLRFHPVMRTLRQILEGETLVSAQVYAGQHLPDWRPGTDYRMSYSASRTQGGGVLRDLSHELDYVNWLCGSWRRLAAAGGHLSDLQIDSDDCWGVLMVTDRCPVVTMQVNYLDQPGHRHLVFNTTRKTVKADLVSCSLVVNGQHEEWVVNRDDTYRSQHLAALEGRWTELCSVDDALAVMELIEAAELAASGGAWIEKESVSAASAPAEGPKASRTKTSVSCSASP